MKALTIWEPWASLIILGVKIYETRGWSTNYRGPLIIHSSVRWSPGQREFTEDLIHVGLLPNDWKPVMGCILGKTQLVDVVMTGEFIRGGLDPIEMTLGDFSVGRFAWKMENPIRLPSPILHRGRQGLWNVDAI